MALLQLRLNNPLHAALQEAAKKYDVPMTSLVKMVLGLHFLENEEEFTPGNIFNADRDNNGRGIPLDELIKAFENAR